MPPFRILSFLIFLFAVSGISAQTHADSEARMLELFKEEKYKEAIPYAIQAKSAAKKEYGDTAKLYILAISNLSFLYEKTGNYPPTESLYEELAEVYKKKFGTDHPAYAVALNSQANAFYASGKLKQALPLYVQALSVQKKVYGMLHAEYWVIAKNLADTYFDLKDYLNAAIHYYDCLKIASTLKGEKSEEYAEALEAAAAVSSKISDLAKAKQYYKTLATLIKEKEGPSVRYASIVNALGILYLDEADFIQAEECLTEALEIRKKAIATEEAGYGQSLNNLGALYRKKGSFQQARRFYEEALVIRKKIGGESDRDYGQTLNNLAELAQAEGNYSLAETLMIRAVDIRKKADGEENEFYALNLNNLASLYTEMGRNEEAVIIHRQVLAIRKKILAENHPEIAQSLNNLGITCENLGQKALAEQYFTESLDIRRKVYGDQHPDYAQSLNNIGQLFSATGRYKEAESVLLNAAAIWQKRFGNTHPNYLLTLDNLAALYINTSAYEKAESLLKGVIAGRKNVLGDTHADYGVSLNNLGALYCLRGRYEEGLALYRQVAAIYQKAWGEEHPSYALALQNTAEIYSRLKNHQAARPLFEQAIRIYLKSLGPDHPAIATPLLGLANLENNAGQYLLAEQLLDSSNRIMMRHMQQNFANLGEEEKMQWWEGEANRFQMAPSLLVSNPHPSKWFLEQTLLQQVQLKGYILKDGTKMLERIRKNGDPVLKKILGEWQANKATLARQYSLPVAERIPQLDSIEKRTTVLEKQLGQQSALFKTAHPDAGLSMEKIRKSLQPGEAAIEWVRFAYYRQGWTDSVLYAAFVLLPGSATARFVLLCEEKELAGLLQVKGSNAEALIKQLYRGTVIRNNSLQGNKADSLYQLIWEPLQSMLSGVKKIYMAPAGLLNRVAFNALAIDSNRYLIDEYELHQLSTIGEIADEKPMTAKDPAEAVCLYGGIDFEQSEPVIKDNPTVIKLPESMQRSIRGGRWNSLPGTLEEVKAIGQLIQRLQKKMTLLSGKAATEESLKQLSGQSPAILHLATHGFSLPDVSKNREFRKGNQFSLAENPLMRAGIILAGANKVWSGGPSVNGKEDGIVTAYEIAGLDLGQTELVVLSACETALGDIRGTEGVFGLQRAFKLAGVRKMILSLWQVPDRETAELMTLFYTYQLQGKSIGVAFRMAQMDMRKKYPVYYWAAFTLLE